MFVHPFGNKNVQHLYNINTNFQYTQQNERLDLFNGKV